MAVYGSQCGREFDSCKTSSSGPDPSIRGLAWPTQGPSCLIYLSRSTSDFASWHLHRLSATTSSFVCPHLNVTPTLSTCPNPVYPLGIHWKFQFLQEALSDLVCNLSLLGTPVVLLLHWVCPGAFLKSVLSPQFVNTPCSGRGPQPLPLVCKSHKPHGQ